MHLVDFTILMVAAVVMEAEKEAVGSAELVPENWEARVKVLAGV